MKYKNKNGISLNYTSDDIHTRLVKEVISKAIIMLDISVTIDLQGRVSTPRNKLTDTIDFLKENFDIVEVEDFIGDTKNV